MSALVVSIGTIIFPDTAEYAHILEKCTNSPRFEGDGQVEDRQRRLVQMKLEQAIWNRLAFFDHSWNVLEKEILRCWIRVSF